MFFFEYSPRCCNISNESLRLQMLLLYMMILVQLVPVYCTCVPLDTVNPSTLDTSFVPCTSSHLLFVHVVPVQYAWSLQAYYIRLVSA
jgi:hypothetical protein